MRGSWTDPYRGILDEEKYERDYHEGYQDGDYSKRGQTSVMRDKDKRSSAYNRGFKAASGYTPDQWEML